MRVQLFFNITLAIIRVKIFRFSNFRGPRPTANIAKIKLQRKLVDLRYIVTFCRMAVPCWFFLFHGYVSFGLSHSYVKQMLSCSAGVLVKHSPASPLYLYLGKLLELFSLVMCNYCGMFCLGLPRDVSLVLLKSPKFPEHYLKELVY